jgi:hypothetical protein
MRKTQPEKLDTLIRAWIADAIRDDVIPVSQRTRISGVAYTPRRRRTDVATDSSEMAAD